MYPLKSFSNQWSSILPYISSLMILCIHPFLLYLNFFTLNTCKLWHQFKFILELIFKVLYLTLGVDISTIFSFSFPLAAFWPIGRRNKEGDDGLHSLFVGVLGLEDDEYAPEVEFFVLFVEGFDESASQLGSSLNNLHALFNVNFSCYSWW